MMFWVIDYFLLSSMLSITPINTPSFFTPCIPYKTQFPYDENIILEARFLRCITHVSWFVLRFNLLLALILLLLFDVVPSILLIYPSYIVMMSRQILFPDIANTTSHHAPKRKCETHTNQCNFCAITTIFRLLFFNLGMKCMQYLVGIFAISPISLFTKFIMIFFCKIGSPLLPEDQLEPRSQVC
jgi:hypothetical protein